MESNEIISLLVEIRNCLQNISTQLIEVKCECKKISSNVSDIRGDSAYGMDDVVHKLNDVALELNLLQYKF